MARIGGQPVATTREPASSARGRSVAGSISTVASRI
jgi:hypothetical protein